MLYPFDYLSVCLFCLFDHNREGKENRARNVRRQRVILSCGATYALRLVRAERTGNHFIGRQKLTKSAGPIPSTDDQLLPVLALVSGPPVGGVSHVCVL